MGLVFSAFYSVISAVNTCRTRTSLHIFTNLVGMHIFEEPCECPSSRVTSPEGPSRQAMKNHDFRKIVKKKHSVADSPICKAGAHGAGQFDGQPLGLIKEKHRTPEEHGASMCWVKAPKNSEKWPRNTLLKNTLTFQEPHVISSNSR